MIRHGKFVTTCVLVAPPPRNRGGRSTAERAAANGGSTQLMAFDYIHTWENRTRSLTAGDGGEATRWLTFPARDGID